VFDIPGGMNHSDYLQQLMICFNCKYASLIE
jgi:hypothetical protein